MAGDSNEQAGYSAIGRLFAIGYLKGIREAVYRSLIPLSIIALSFGLESVLVLNILPPFGASARCRQ